MSDTNKKIKKINLGGVIYDLTDAEAQRKLVTGEGISINDTTNEISLVQEYLINKILETQAKTLFVGTMEEYNTADAAGKIPIGCLVFITNESVATSDASSPILGKGVLGSLILA